MKSFLLFCRFCMWLVVIFSASLILILSSSYLYLSPSLPDIASIRDIQLQIPLRVYTKEGELIGEFGEKRRTPIKISDTPLLFKQAILAAEDNNFFEHPGIDLTGLARATVQLVRTGSIQSGGSTITMQVAKNYLLSSERSFTRKFSEILLALQMERELSKDEILELYINKIYLGNRAYGIQAAANIYYNKNIDQLSLPELAMIAGLPKAPSAYNPVANAQRALERRNWILYRMQRLDYISPETMTIAQMAPVTAKDYGAKLAFEAPYIAEMARQKTQRLFPKDIYTAGYKVFTTVDGKLQKSAQKAIEKGLLDYDRSHGYRGPEAHFDSSEEALAYLKKANDYADLVPALVTAVSAQSITAEIASGQSIVITWEHGISDAKPYISINRQGPTPTSAHDVASIGDIIRVRHLQNEWYFSQTPEAQAALVALSPQNGAILSLVGGFNYKYSKFNRATQAARQPGSNFKPFIYAAALENGFTAATIINDAPVVFDDAGLEDTWRPENSSGKFLGPTRFRKALYQSRNLVSIRVLKETGINNAINYVSRFGFDKKALPRDLSLALGTHAVPPIDIATAYATFANRGFHVEPFLIEHVENSEGKTVYQSSPKIACPDDNCQLAKTEPNTTEEADSLEDLLSEKNAMTNPVNKAERIMDPRTHYIIHSILRDVVEKGTARKARELGRQDIAGKTGTTNGPTDAWFSGYNQHIVTTAWLGFDQNQKLGNNEYGGSVALPIWMDFMRDALAGQPDIPMPQPSGIITVKIDPETGLLARPNQPNAIFELFRQENVPTRIAPSDKAGSENPINDVFSEEIF